MFLPIYLCALLLLFKNVFASDETATLVDIYSPSDSKEPTCGGALIAKKWVIASKSCMKGLPLRLVLTDTTEEATIENEDELTIVTDNVPVPLMFAKFPTKEISTKTTANISYRSRFDLGSKFGRPVYNHYMTGYGQHYGGRPGYVQEGYRRPVYRQQAPSTY